MRLLQDSFDLVPLPPENFTREKTSQEDMPMPMDFLPPPPDSPPPNLPEIRDGKGRSDPNAFTLSMIPEPDF